MLITFPHERMIVASIGRIERSLDPLTVLSSPHLFLSLLVPIPAGFRYSNLNEIKQRMLSLVEASSLAHCAQRQEYFIEPPNRKVYGFQET
jgi:hypothetical protein